MRIDNNGFTLVELLAVIVILAIILAVAIPKITTLIENSQINAFKSNEKMMIKAAKTYAEANNVGLPVNEGDTMEITLNTLITNNYISLIKAPDDSTKECNGYVIVTKTGSNTYEYTPHLNCESNIGDRNADGLIANYTFDDFQEPTNNISNKKFSSSSNLIMSNFANGVSTISYDSTASSPVNYTTGAEKAINQSGNSSTLIIWGIGTSLTALKPYTWSIYVKGTGRIQLYSHQVDNGSGGTTGITGPWITLTDNYQRYELTGGLATGYTSQNVGINIENNTTVWYNATQYEQKGYATPFANGARIGVVKDYSGNGKHATLTLNNTPKWLNGNSNARNGSYQFDGSNDVIDYGPVSDNILRQGKEGESWTLSLWTENIQNQDANYRILLARDGWHAGIEMELDTSVTFNIFDENNLARTIVSSPLGVGTSHHIVATYTNRTMYLYVDGVLIGSNNFFLNNPTIRFKSNLSNFTSGATSVGTTHQFKGTISDVRIYTRALSINEIKNIYNSEK